MWLFQSCLFTSQDLFDQFIGTRIKTKLPPFSFLYSFRPSLIYIIKSIAIPVGAHFYYFDDIQISIMSLFNFW